MESPRADAGAVRSLAGVGAGLARSIRVPALSRVAWVDVAWVIFIVLNLIAMRLISAWQTVPFLIIWISLTVMYGFRLVRREALSIRVGVRDHRRCPCRSRAA